MQSLDGGLNISGQQLYAVAGPRCINTNAILSCFLTYYFISKKESNSLVYSVIACFLCLLNCI